MDCPNCHLPKSSVMVEQYKETKTCMSTKYLREISRWKCTNCGKEFTFLKEISYELPSAEKIAGTRLHTQNTSVGWNQ